VSQLTDGFGLVKWGAVGIAVVALLTNLPNNHLFLRRIRIRSFRIRRDVLTRVSDMLVNPPVRFS